MIWTGNVLLLSQISHYSFILSPVSAFVPLGHLKKARCHGSRLLFIKPAMTSALPRSQKYRSNVYSLEFGSHHCCRTLFGGCWRWVGAGMRWGGFPENSWSHRLCGWNPPWDPNCPPSRYTKVAAFLIRTSDALFSTHGDAGIGWTRGWEWSRVLDKCVISSSSPQKGTPHGRLIAHIRPLYQCNCDPFSPWH